MTEYRLSHLEFLEAESIHIFRELAGQFERPVMLYSAGKDSSVLLHLARKAFAPARLPFPLLHIDTGFKFQEMYDFRDEITREYGLELLVHRNESAIANNTNPYDLGTQRCCGFLKTEGLLGGLRAGNYDAAIGGARRDEEASRAKERIFSFRDKFGQWDPKSQRPELWSLYNGKVAPGESIRIFPLSNWTELDVWHYIARENIPIASLYFAKERDIVLRNDQLIPVTPSAKLFPGEKAQKVLCRFRTLGCSPCTGAVASSAMNVQDIIEEIIAVRISERSTRIIDHDSSGSMETKKREGYF